MLETVHGNEVWAGILVNMTNKFNFSTNKKITVKVYAAATGKMRIKLENADKTTEFIEKMWT